MMMDGGDNRAMAVVSGHTETAQKNVGSHTNGHKFLCGHTNICV